MDSQTIDLRVGEPRCIRDVTCRLFGLDNYSLRTNLNDWEYQSKGYAPLVRLLEDKHNAPVVITNGANQALYAAMCAAKAMGCKNVGFRRPYWTRFPEIANRVKLSYSTFSDDTLGVATPGIDCYLITVPNNPDGFVPKLEILRSISETLKGRRPFIHDAAYYTRSYLPVDHPIEPIGDMQIFSASKAYGLSSLRVGYVVCHNTSFYQKLLEYVELMTVGVSVVSQQLFLHILKREVEVTALQSEFEQLTREELKKAKLAFKKINPSLVSIPENLERTCGMFAWVKPKMLNLFERANIAVLSGEKFGGYENVRVNLAAGLPVINEAVNRLNALDCT